MEMEQILKLIETVSSSSLTSFKYEEGESCLTLEVSPEGKKVGTITEGAVEKIIEQDENQVIKSTIVGTFYVSREEGGTPLVSVGDGIKVGQIIGIIEAMKLMNEVESDVEGTVTEILVKDGQLVEYGQPLLKVKV